MKTKIQNVEAGPNAASVAKTPLTCTSTARRAADFVEASTYYRFYYTPISINVDSGHLHEMSCIYCKYD